MNCRRIKELLMTDYIDAEVSQELNKEIRDHLSACSKCRELYESLRKAAVEPFKKAEEIQPPDSVWNKIEQAVTKQEELTEGLLVRLRDNLCSIFSVRKPAFAAATIMVVILIAVFFARVSLNQQNELNYYLEQQMDFLSYLDADAANYFDDIDLDTTIEEYFL